MGRLQQKHVKEKQVLTEINQAWLDKWCKRCLSKVTGPLRPLVKESSFKGTQRAK